MSIIQSQALNNYSSEQVGSFQGGSADQLLAQLSDRVSHAINNPNPAEEMQVNQDMARSYFAGLHGMGNSVNQVC